MEALVRLYPYKTHWEGYLRSFPILCPKCLVDVKHKRKHFFSQYFECPQCLTKLKAFRKGSRHPYISYCASEWGKAKRVIKNAIKELETLQPHEASSVLLEKVKNKIIEELTLEREMESTQENLWWCDYCSCPNHSNNTNCEYCNAPRPKMKKDHL